MDSNLSEEMDLAVANSTMVCNLYSFYWNYKYNINIIKIYKWLLGSPYSDFNPMIFMGKNEI